MDLRSPFPKNTERSSEKGFLSDMKPKPPREILMVRMSRCLQMDDGDEETADVIWGTVAVAAQNRLRTGKENIHP